MSALPQPSIEMTDMHCGECGIVFYVPQYWYEARAIKGENHGAFVCPNGHNRVFTEPKVQRLERELKEEKTKLWQTQMELAQEKVKLEKLNKRIRNGVCPHCKRHFANLQRHIECKHKKP